MKQGHIVVVQNCGVKIPLPETKAMFQGVAQPVGEVVHPGIAKATVPFDIDHGRLVRKTQSCLLKYPAHVYQHGLMFLLNRNRKTGWSDRLEVIRILKSQITSIKKQINLKIQYSMIETSLEFRI
jgi:hypothetical protein